MKKSLKIVLIFAIVLIIIQTIIVVSIYVSRNEQNPLTLLGNDRHKTFLRMKIQVSHEFSFDYRCNNEWFHNSHYDNTK